MRVAQLNEIGIVAAGTGVPSPFRSQFLSPGTFSPSVLHKLLTNCAFPSFELTHAGPLEFSGRKQRTTQHVTTHNIKQIPPPIASSAIQRDIAQKLLPLTESCRTRHYGHALRLDDLKRYELKTRSTIKPPSSSSPSSCHAPVSAAAGSVGGLTTTARLSPSALRIPLNRSCVRASPIALARATSLVSVLTWRSRSSVSVFRRTKTFVAAVSDLICSTLRKSRVMAAVCTPRVSSNESALCSCGCCAISFSKSVYLHSHLTSQSQIDIIFLRPGTPRGLVGPIEHTLEQNRSRRLSQPPHASFVLQAI